jgi:hypothetical protein
MQSVPTCKCAVLTGGCCCCTAALTSPARSRLQTDKHHHSHPHPHPHTCILRCTRCRPSSSASCCRCSLPCPDASTSYSSSSASASKAAQYCRLALTCVRGTQQGQQQRPAAATGGSSIRRQQQQRPVPGWFHQWTACCMGLLLGCAVGLMLSMRVLSFQAPQLHPQGALGEGCAHKWSLSHTCLEASLHRMLRT